MGFKKLDRAVTRQRKKKSIRKKISGTADRPRLAVFKSSRNVYAQLVDDTSQKTLTGISSLTPGLKADIAKAGTKVERAFVVGQAIAEKAKELNIEGVVFDRSGYVYHGRVKAVAEGARKGGLKF